MKMCAELFAPGNYLHDSIAQLFRIERTDTHAFDGRSLGDHLEQAGEINLRREVLAVAAQMHAREHDFLEAARVQIVERVHHPPRVDTARGAARKWHDTKSTKLIAAFLQFQKRARMTVERHRAKFDRRLLLA